jgi:SAM-dependent methyltransferase
MQTTVTDYVFAGSVPQIYEAHLVPLIFEPYAHELADRLRPRPLNSVLELAAGTGSLTRALTAVLPEAVAILATDLNAAMLDRAQHVGMRRPVEWQTVDAMQLPFADQSFDAVGCQFGVMFFADKHRAFAEAHRVLKPGGLFAFSVWDRLSENAFADAVTQALERRFPDDPPRFLERTPHGYHDLSAIEHDLAAAGFRSPVCIETVERCSRAVSCPIPALAYCQGTPLRNEIEAREPAQLPRVTDEVARAIGRHFGPGPVEGKTRAFVVSVER